jgi:acetoin utilization deacetylase AcuC-like enzyme
LEEDFEWVTTCLVRIANSCCNGRIVSALEGGYQIGGEYCSSFAKSVKAHVQALARGANSRAPYRQEYADVEKNMEVEVLYSMLCINDDLLLE